MINRWQNVQTESINHYVQLCWFLLIWFHKVDFRRKRRITNDLIETRIQSHQWIQNIDIVQLSEDDQQQFVGEVHQLCIGMIHIQCSAQSFPLVCRSLYLHSGSIWPLPSVGMVPFSPAHRWTHKGDTFFLSCFRHPFLFCHGRNIGHLQFLSLFDRHGDGCVLFFTFDRSAQMVRKTVTIKKANPRVIDHCWMRLVQRFSFNLLDCSMPSNISRAKRR